MRSSESGPALSTSAAGHQPPSGVVPKATGLIIKSRLVVAAFSSAFSNGNTQFRPVLSFASGWSPAASSAVNIRKEVIGRSPDVLIGRRPTYNLVARRHQLFHQKSPDSWIPHLGGSVPTRWADGGSGRIVSKPCSRYRKCFESRHCSLRVDVSSKLSIQSQRSMRAGW